MGDFARQSLELDAAAQNAQLQGDDVTFGFLDRGDQLRDELLVVRPSSVGKRRVGMNVHERAGVGENAPVAIGVHPSHRERGRCTGAWALRRGPRGGP